MNLRQMGLVSLIAAAVGCATVYSRPDTTDAQRRADYDRCDARAREIVRTSPRFEVATAEARAMAIISIRKRCMLALDYTIGDDEEAG